MFIKDFCRKLMPLQKIAAIATILGTIVAILTFGYTILKDQENVSKKEGDDRSSDSQKTFLYQRNAAFHIGDEDFRKWPALEGDCFSTVIQIDRSLKSLRLEYEAYGIESAIVKINGESVSRISPQVVRPYEKWPNYWSQKNSIILPSDSLQIGRNEVAICAQPIRNPEHPGDLDDFQLRQVVIVADEVWE